MANVLITGGSRGIGAACVRRFAQAGHRVWFLYEKEHEAANAVAAETGAEPICADVSDGEAVRAAFRRCPDVDILVCNAGIAIPGLLSMLPEDIRESYRSLLIQEEGSLEARLVKAADKLSAYIKCVEEQKAGNTEFDLSLIHI